MKKTLLLFILLTSSFNVFAVEYISDEFNDPESHAAVMYTCAVTGTKEEYEPEAFRILQTAYSQMGANMKGRQASNLMADSLKWYESKKNHFDFYGYWYEKCEPPFANMKNLIEN